MYNVLLLLLLLQVGDLYHTNNPLTLLLSVAADYGSRCSNKLLRS